MSEFARLAPSTRRSHASALDRTLALLGSEQRPRFVDGYLDLLGEDPTTPTKQRWTANQGLPLLHERVWRPLCRRLLSEALGPAVAGEYRLIEHMLSIANGDLVLDLGCGAGAFTRAFALPAATGLVVGLDGSRAMLARAAAVVMPTNVTYLRADASALPFADGSFDAVCCFAAPHLIERPLRTLDEIARVLAPGGRVALLASCDPGLRPATITRPLVQGLTGLRVFGPDELTAALAERGLVDVWRRVASFAQFVSARKPEAAWMVAAADSRAARAASSRGRL